MNERQTYETVVKLLKKFPEMYKSCFIDKGSYIFRDKENLHQCLDYIQKIADTFTKTANVEFNRTLYKLLACVGNYAFYHYYADEHMDYISHGAMVVKEIIEFKNIAYFIEEKYVKNSDVYITAFFVENAMCPLNLNVYIDVLGKTDTVSLGSFFLVHKNKNLSFTLSDIYSQKNISLTVAKTFTHYVFKGSSNNFAYMENNETWDDRNWNFN